MVYNKPLPRVNPDSKPFWEGCKKHELRFQKCRQCGFVLWPASILCPKCYSSEMEWIVASGKGKVYTFIVYRETPLKEFESELPYVVAIVELEEKVLLVSRIVNCSPEQVKIEMPVEVTWEDVTEEFSLPMFKPAS